jgi:protein-tyrosine phosphatase
MENHHRKAVLDLDPAARGKTFLLGHWTNTEIPDPYRRGDQVHAQAMHLIDTALESWLEKFVSRG